MKFLVKVVIQEKIGNVLKLPFLLTILLLELTAKNLCYVHDDIMLSILKTEAHFKKGAGYQYLISFNNLKDKKLVKQSILKKYFIDTRTIDCKNVNLCVKLTKALWSIGILNLDLGAFQLNSKYHKTTAKNYFILKESYKIACNYVEKNIKRKGKNWYAIAGYHSFTKKHNNTYKKLLIRNYKSIIKWKKTNKG